MYQNRIGFRKKVAGLVDGIITIWLKAWGFAFIVAFPIIVVVSPIVRRLVNVVVDESG